MVSLASCRSVWNFDAPSDRTLLTASSLDRRLLRTDSVDYFPQACEWCNQCFTFIFCTFPYEHAEKLLRAAVATGAENDPPRRRESPVDFTQFTMAYMSLATASSARG